MNENVKRTLFITDSYPYGNGEQFIETELKFWSKKFAHSGKLMIFPLSSSSCQRKTPENIEVRNCLTKFELDKFKLIKSLCNVYFICDLWYLAKSKKLSFNSVKHNVSEHYKFFYYKDKLKKIIKDERIDIVYGYWNTPSIYSAGQLKSTYPNLKVYSRCHGYDLYEERTPQGFHPIKRVYSRGINKFFTLSNSAKKYLVDRYNIVDDSIEVSRLGVEITEKINPDSRSDEFNIISVSNCIKLKRIDKIINAINILARKNPHKKISWTHVGTGVEFNDLSKLASDKLSVANVNYNFTGEKEHAEVLKILEEVPFDVFVNSSESEGVPVSIMEAMNNGIPIIAPDVGGVSELLSNTKCILLNSHFDIYELASSLQCILDVKIDSDLIKEHLSFAFNAEVNYTLFIDNITGEN